MADNPEKRVDEAPISSGTGTDAAGGEDFSAPAASPNESAEQIIRALRDQNRQLTDQLLRTKAEMDNARKRMVKEKEEFQQFAIFQTLQALLPILDGFELALAAEGGGEDYRRGVEIIYLQFQGTLQRLGLEPVEAKGKLFDPNVHEAIASVETTEVPDQHVVDELQRGFFYRNRLIRPAKVRIANRPEADLST
jgi:molecular chaperone GrpE